MTRHLGEFEQLLLFALVELRDGGHGGAIRKLIEERTGRVVSPGAVYTAMERLQARGYVSSSIGATTPARGGRRRKYYAIEPDGARELERSFTTLTSMAQGLTPSLREIAGEGDGGGDR